MRERLALGVSHWLALAASPTFALMAFLTAAAGDSHSAALGMAAGLPPLLTGMTPMYLLMALFHLAPWFRPAAGARG